MRIHTLRREQVVDGTPQEVFPFFADAHNLEAITPPLLRFTIVTPPPITMRAGTLIEYRLRVHGVPVRWRTQIQDWTPPERFVDVLLRGPYALWHHTHEFEAVAGGRTRMTDTVRYAVGLGPLGALAHRMFVARDVAAIFDHREQVIGPLLAAQRAATSPVG
ncbi:MAG TPA: SRPBCC family protein [Solirubrobacteraceae bacterium]|nr:SRPBCC family protein [Solirubrobacteraceae bacterium]